MIKETTKKYIQMDDKLIKFVEKFQDDNNCLSFSEATRQIITKAMVEAGQ